MRRDHVEFYADKTIELLREHCRELPGDAVLVTVPWARSVLISMLSGVAIQPLFDQQQKHEDERAADAEALREIRSAMLRLAGQMVRCDGIPHPGGLPWTHGISRKFHRAVDQNWLRTDETCRNWGIELRKLHDALPRSEKGGERADSTSLDTGALTRDAISQQSAPDRPPATPDRA